MPEEQPLAADLERGVIGEQFAELSPLALVDEVAVGALDLLDLIHVLEPGDAGIELVELLLGGLFLRQSGSGERKRQRKAKPEPLSYG